MICSVSNSILFGISALLLFGIRVQVHMLIIILIAYYLELFTFHCHDTNSILLG
jgi:hypothetical protein